MPNLCSLSRRGHPRSSPLLSSVLRVKKKKMLRYGNKEEQISPGRKATAPSRSTSLNPASGWPRLAPPVLPRTPNPQFHLASAPRPSWLVASQSNPCLHASLSVRSLISTHPFISSSEAGNFWFSYPQPLGTTRVCAQREHDGRERAHRRLATTRQGQGTYRWPPRVEKTGNHQEVGENRIITSTGVLI